MKTASLVTKLFLMNFSIQLGNQEVFPSKEQENTPRGGGININLSLAFINIKKNSFGVIYSKSCQKGRYTAGLFKFINNYFLIIITYCPNEFISRLGQ